MEKITNVLNEKKFTNTKLSLDNRKKLTLTGVEKALSSNDTAIIFQVSGTKVYVTGTKLEIEKLDVENGIAEVGGEIDGIKYGTKASGNIFKRIFK